MTVEVAVGVSSPFLDGGEQPLNPDSSPTGDRLGDPPFARTAAASNTSVQPAARSIARNRRYVWQSGAPTLSGRTNVSMGTPEVPHNHSADETVDEEFEEIGVDITEDNMVWIHGEEWELVLSPAEARELAQAIIEAAADAEADIQEPSA